MLAEMLKSLGLNIQPTVRKIGLFAMVGPEAGRTPTRKLSSVETTTTEFGATGLGR